MGKWADLAITVLREAGHPLSVPEILELAYEEMHLSAHGLQNTRGTTQDKTLRNEIRRFCAGVDHSDPGDYVWFYQHERDVYGLVEWQDQASSGGPSSEGTTRTGGGEDWEAIDADIDELGRRPIDQTEKEQLINARRGQGGFREAVARVEQRCRVTGVEAPEFLEASHIRPWRSCTDEERLDGENGLLLTPNAHLLFDRGYISFADNGTLLLSPAVDARTLEALGIPTDRSLHPRTFTDRQKRYLSYHRSQLFCSNG